MEAVFEALDLNIWTFLLQAVNVLVVLGGLYLLLWKPLGKAMLEREERIQKDLQAANSSKEEANSILASYQQQLDQASQEGKAILQRATEMAEVARQETVAQAKKEAARALEQVRQEIEKEKGLAIAAIHNQAADIAVAVAGKVLARTLKPNDQEYLLQEALTEVERLQ